MELRKCEVEACGAMVMVVALEGHPYPVNPTQTQLAVPQEDGGFRLVKGFQPHAYTCVDIAARAKARAAVKTHGS
jgi:hypothetical protein